MPQRKFGWKPDLPDHRDFQYGTDKELREFRLARSLPISVDLRPKMSPIENQGELGSCVAHATAGALEFLELVALAQAYKDVEIFPEFNPMSRLFIYYNARALDGDPNHDNGTQLRSAVKAINKWGICTENLWPYNTTRVNEIPDSLAYDQAKSHLVTSYLRLNNSQLPELKICLAAGYPFIFGISVYDSFMSDEVAKTGIVPMPKHDESQVGGHALCCVGYDDAKQVFIIRNSWGTDWGMQGYCYLPYVYLVSPQLASDFWTIRRQVTLPDLPVK